MTCHPREGTVKAHHDTKRQWCGGKNRCLEKLYCLMVLCYGNYFCETS